MKHSHSHSCKCSHSAVRFCGHCNTVYCLNCNQEWTPKFIYNWTNPWYTYIGGVKDRLDYNTLGAVSAGSASAEISSVNTCKHQHE